MDKGSILVIDDEKVMCSLLKDALNERGYNVITAQKAKDGLKIAKDDTFDVVITDLKMPDVNGIEILREVKKFNEDNVVVVITAYPSFETAQEALKIGAYDYITKPFNLDEIAFTVKRATDFHRLILSNKKLIKELEKQNILLEEKVKKRTEELFLIQNISRDISSKLRLDDVLSSIADRIISTLNLNICVILLFDEASRELSIRCARGLDNRSIAETRLKLGERISGWVLKQNKSILIEDVNKDPKFKDRGQERYYANSLISIPLVAKNKLLGVININDKKAGEAFNERELKLLEEVGVGAAIAIDNANLYENLQRMYMHTVNALISAIDARDHYTRSHSEHVTRISVIVAEEMGLSDQEIDIIKNACQLHDLGKIGIHDYILTKPGKLTEEEWEEIRLHSLKGAEILEPLGFLNGVIDIVRQHHERFDGKGYPYGYKEEAIMLGARIIAVADSYDAMLSERPYRKRPFLKKEAIEEIKKNSGTQFDPKVVEAFLKVVDRL